jgi:hypothetical protein
MTRVAVRTLFAVLLVAILAPAPFLFRAAERQRLLGPWQGEWLDAEGWRADVRGGDLVAYFRITGRVANHYEIGQIGPDRVELYATGQRGRGVLPLDCTYHVEAGRLVVRQLAGADATPRATHGRPFLDLRRP